MILPALLARFRKDPYIVLVDNCGHRSAEHIIANYGSTMSSEWDVWVELPAAYPMGCNGSRKRTYGRPFLAKAAPTEETESPEETTEVINEPEAPAASV